MRMAAPKPGLLAEVLAPIPFDRVVTSGLSRTLDTAQIVVAARNIPIQTVPALQEIRGGA